MLKKLVLGAFLCVLLVANGYTQRPIGGDALILDNNAGKQITIMAPPGLPNSYTWILPLFPPPTNSAFSEAGTLTGQMLRWDNTLGYWVATSALFASGTTAGSFVGIGTTTPARLLDIAGTSGTPNVRVQSLSGITNWGLPINGSDGFVFANASGDLLKRSPQSVLGQFAWMTGGNANPASSILGTTTAQPLDLRTNGISRMLFSAGGDITVQPGEGSNVIMNNIFTDNTSTQFLTVDASARVRLRSLSSILDVNANEGLVYDSPNIKLGATDVSTNPFIVNRYVNLANNTLTFTFDDGATMLALQGNNGNVGIGTAPGTFKLEVAGNVGPAFSNSYDLGSNTMRWRDIYVGPSSLHIGNGADDQTTLSYTNNDQVQRFNVDADDDEDIEFNVDGTGNVEFTGALEPNGDAGTTGQYLRSSGTNTPPIWESITNSAWGITGNAGTDATTNFIGTSDDQEFVFRTNDIPRARFLSSTFDEDSGAFIPDGDNIYSLGTETQRWRHLNLGPGSIRMGSFINSAKGGQSPQTLDQVTISYVDGTLIIDKPLGSTGSMVPNNSDIFTLGTPTNRWKDLYLGPSSLHIGDDTLEAKISYEPSVAELRFNTNGIGPTEVTMFGNGNVAIANLSAGGLLKAAPGTGIISVASGGSDFESPLTFTNGLTRTTNTVTLGGALTTNTDIALSGFTHTFSGFGRVGIGTITPANKFSVGVASQFQVDSLGTIAAAAGITSSGSIQFTSLGSGLVKSTSGVLGIATAGTDYESPLTFGNGLTRTANAITLGGTLTQTTTIALGGFDVVFSGTGNIGIGDATPASPLTVGSGDLFQVDASGDLIRINGVTYTWPDSNSTGTLTNDGSGGLTWATASSSVSSINGENGSAQTFATSATGTDFTITSGSGVHTFNLPDASDSSRGVVSLGSQSFAGEKTFLQIARFDEGMTVNNGMSLNLKENMDNGDDSLSLTAYSLDESYSLDFPPAPGQTGEVLTYNGEGGLYWSAPGGAAAGNGTEVQYNDDGAFAASANFTYDGTTLGVTSSGDAVTAVSSSTTDEEFAVYGNASGNSTNQIIGVWGDASNTNSANTGTIGVLATGNGNTGATATNVAAQINDGEFAMGRTTETTGLTINLGATAALAEAATGGSAYSAQGPSGVVQVTNLSVGVSNAQTESAGVLTIPNRYVNASSIILVTVFDATAAAGANEFSFSTQVRARDDDSFDVTVNVIKNGPTARTLTGYKLGYMILNPSK